MSGSLSNRKFCNSSFSHHYTEEHPDTLNFLRNVFRSEPLQVSYKGDVFINGKIVEIKSCREKIKETNKWGKNWRYGRFIFEGHEIADYILFVGVKDSGFVFYLDDASKYPLGTYFRIPFNKIFKGN